MSSPGDQRDAAPSLALGTEDRHRRRALVGDEDLIRAGIEDEVLWPLADGDGRQAPDLTAAQTRRTHQGAGQDASEPNHDRTLRPTRWLSHSMT
jgi:hypothetical protein